MINEAWLYKLGTHDHTYSFSSKFFKSIVQFNDHTPNMGGFSV